MDEETLTRLTEEFIPFNKFLGVRVGAIRKGFTRLEIPFRPELIGDPLRPALHGGVLSMLADTAGGMAVWSGIADDRSRVSTIDLRIDYLRPGKQETLVAEGTVVHAELLEPGQRPAGIAVELPFLLGQHFVKGLID